MSKRLILQSSGRAIACLLAVAVLSPADDAVKKKDLSAPPDMTSFWNDPGGISTRDLYYGIGGRAHRPQGPFVFLKEDMSGTNPKFSVRDSNGVKWKVKLGSEARGETAATRFVWAAGYYADEDYVVPNLKVESMPKLRRGEKYVGADGTMQNARLKRESKDEKKASEWKWRDNPFVDTREWNGLRVVMALIDNWDLKDVNNAVRDIGGKPVYLVSDLGASFGGVHTGSPKGEAEAYAKAKFITDVSDNTVSFAAPGRPPIYHRFRFPISPIASTCKASAIAFPSTTRAGSARFSDSSPMTRFNPHFAPPVMARIPCSYSLPPFARASPNSTGCRAGRLVLLAELDIVQFGVEAFGRHQLIVRAALCDRAVFDDEDHVRRLDGGQTMRDHDGGLAFHQPIQRLEDQLFGRGSPARSWAHPESGSACCESRRARWRCAAAGRRRA